MRLDQYIVQCGLARSRTQAQQLISEGAVAIKCGDAWLPTRKASSKMAGNEEIQIAPSAAQQFVSRAGLKLQGALEAIELKVEGMTALDVGQSTGGFSDCLLQGGAKRVVGVEVGHGQLAAGLRANPKIVCLENINARELNASLLQKHALPTQYDLVVMDVSFISQTLILPALVPLMAPGAWLVSLVKPQFEVGPEGLGKGGIVRDKAAFEAVQKQMCAAAKSLDLKSHRYFESSIQGSDGNHEFFITCTRC